MSQLENCQDRQTRFQALAQVSGADLVAPHCLLRKALAIILCCRFLVAILLRHNHIVVARFIFRDMGDSRGALLNEEKMLICSGQVLDEQGKTLGQGQQKPKKILGKQKATQKRSVVVWLPLLAISKKGIKSSGANSGKFESITDHINQLSMQNHPFPFIFNVYYYENIKKSQAFAFPSLGAKKLDGGARA